MGEVATGRSAGTLGDRVSNIFCNALARKYGDEATVYAKKNAVLTPIQKTMQKLKIQNGTKEDIVVDLTANNRTTEDGSYYVYEFEEDLVTFDHTRLNRLVFEFAGVFCFLDNFLHTPTLTTQDGEVRVSFPLLRDHLIMQGKLENCQGSLEDVDHAIETNQIALYWDEMGAINMDTGQPIIPMNSSLVGATFHLETIKICKQIVDGIATAGWGDEPEPLSEEGGELRRLATAFPNHDCICQAANDYENSKKKHHRLVPCRELFQTVVGKNPKGPLFSFKLEDGRVDRMMTTNDSRAWRLEPKSTDEAKVLLTSLADFSVSLGGIPIATPSKKASLGVEVLPGGQGIAIVFRGMFELEAVFLFDESIQAYQNDVDIIGRIHYSGIPERGNTTIRGRNGRPVERLGDVTVRLLFLQVRLDRIQQHLNMLRIEAKVEDEDTEEA